MLMDIELAPGTTTTQDVLSAYITNNWEIRDISDIEIFRALVKPMLSDSYGGPIPYVNNGLVVKIPVDVERNSFLIFAYYSRNTADILNIDPNSLLSALEKSEIAYEEFPTTETDILKCFSDAKETFKNDLCINCRLFIIENDIVVSTLNYTFLFDIKTLSVIHDSIVAQVENKWTLILSEEFIKCFDTEDTAQYARSVILASISYLLESFK